MPLRRLRAVRPRRRSLRARLVLATILLTAAASLVIGLVTVGPLRLFLEHRLDDQLISAAGRPRRAVDRPPGPITGVPPLLAARRPRPDNRGTTFLQAPGQGQGTLTAVIDANGTVTWAGILDNTGDPTRLTGAQE